MPTALDHTQDFSGQETHRLISLYPPPEFVKNAEHARLHGDPETMKSHVYGDPKNRLYPCHTAAATWMSTLFFTNKQAAYKPAEAAQIKERLEKAARYFQIEPICTALVEKIAADSTCDLSQLPDSDFAMVWVEGDRKERHYPLRNAAEVKMASEWFAQYRDHFVFADRSRIAQKILEKASDHSVDISARHDMLTKTAGLGYCPTEEIVDALNSRAMMVNRTHADCATELRQFATLVAANPVGLDSSMLHKVAAVVDQFDRFTKLDRLYDKGLDRPEDLLFKVTQKTANDFVANHFQMISGTVYEKAAFDGLPFDHVKSWMGDAFASEVSAGGLVVDAEKVATIAATLPRGDAEMFDQMAREAGIKVFARDKAAWHTGIPQDELMAMANAHEVTTPSVLD